MAKKKLPKTVVGLICIALMLGFFIYMGSVMGASNMLNTMMHTAHDLLLNTVFFLMAICVIMGALARVLISFHGAGVIERLLRPLMRPLFHLPGIASLGAVMTFLSDNPAIIAIAKDPKVSKYLKKYELVCLTNFGTAFGMGLIVIIFMCAQGFTWEPFAGLFGAFVGCIVSTRLMQRFTLKDYPQYKDEYVVSEEERAALPEEDKAEKPFLIRFLDAILDGGKSGVEVGMCIIPGVLVISTFVMMLTFGPSDSGAFTGAAYEGTGLLPALFGKINFVFDWLFGFKDSHLVSFPITALGAVGAALSLVPEFISQGWMDGNAIAVCTAIGMCWSGYLSTHTAMLDTLGYRHLTGKAILAHTIGGMCAGFVAHWTYVLVMLII